MTKNNDNSVKELNAPFLQKSNLSSHLKLINVRDYFSIIALAIVLLFFSILSPRFLSVANLSNIAQQASVFMVAAMGASLVILSGSIDLSVGSVLGISAVLAAGFSSQLGLPRSQPAVAIDLGLYAPIIGIAAGCFIGWINGVLLSKGKLPSFIVTLGMMTIVRGIILLYTKGRAIPLYDQRLLFFGSGSILGIPCIFIIAMVTFFIFHILLAYTPFGRSVRAIGGKERVAHLSGIAVNRTKILIFTLAGFCAGLAGFIQSARTAAGTTTTGEGVELDVIAAVVLGGMPLTGGVGRIYGSVLGVLIMVSLGSGLNMLGVSPYAQRIVKGIVLILAVFITLDRSKIDVIK